MRNRAGAAFLVEVFAARVVGSKIGHESVSFLKQCQQHSGHVGGCLARELVQ
jgi:hypothetical protein